MITSGTKRIGWSLWILATLIMGMGMGSAAPSLKVGSPTVPAGTHSVEVPLMLNAGQHASVVALEVELQYEPARLHFQSARPGPVAQSAQKQVSANGRTPGTLKVLLFGLNQRIISPGVIAHLAFEVTPHAARGAVPLRILSVKATDAQGHPVPLQMGNGQITIQ